MLVWVCLYSQSGDGNETEQEAQQLGLRICHSLSSEFVFGSAIASPAKMFIFTGNYPTVLIFDEIMN